MWRVLIVLLMLAGCDTTQRQHAHLVPTNFEQLPYFSSDNHPEALRALQKSCIVGRTTAPATGFSPAVAVDPAIWRSLCQAAKGANLADAEQFFRTHFTPYHVAGTEGKFTGYYIPLLQASRTKNSVFRYPAYGLPPELKNGTGRRPYHDRAAIDRGALAGRGLEILWFNDPVMLFFAEIQGSATAELPDGKHVRIVYAGKNGHAYKAIGKTLVERGELAQSQVSMQSIRDWLYAHPAQAPEIMQTNASYVFFALDESGDEVKGAHGSPLTPKRSLAVDKNFIPLGLPLYLATNTPNGDSLHRVVVAQDIGGAIKGAARGDVFFGYGKEAEAQAGRMNASGSLYVLLPKGGSYDR